MADEPIVLTHQVEPQIQEHVPSIEHPSPTPEQESLADGLFTPDQEKAIAAMMNLQAGLMLTHHIVRETFEEDEEEIEPKPEPKKPKS